MRKKYDQWRENRRQCTWAELVWHAYHWRGQKARQRRGEPCFADASQFLDELRVCKQTKRADNQSGHLNWSGSRRRRRRGQTCCSGLSLNSFGLPIESSHDRCTSRCGRKRRRGEALKLGMSALDNRSARAWFESKIQIFDRGIRVIRVHHFIGQRLRCRRARRASLSHSAMSRLGGRVRFSVFRLLFGFSVSERIVS